MSGKTSYLFPGGKPKALTFSFDDGVVQDERLIELFNRFGLKGTFNLNSGVEATARRLPLTQEMVKRIYSGHEIACHAVHHPHLEFLPNSDVMTEVWKDREALEELTGEIVTGLAYPYGSFTPEVIAALKAGGIEYARTVDAASSFLQSIPEDFLRWNPTCHYRKAMDYVPSFLRAYGLGKPMIFYVWGHAYELDDNDEWGLMESLASQLADQDGVWYATNLQICRYVKAVRALVVSTDQRRIYNPSAETVWLHHGDEKTDIVMIEPGKTVTLE